MATISRQSLPCAARLSDVSEQLAPVINRYANSIYLLQGIFVGNWGEMIHSDYLSGNDLTALTEKLASLTDPSIFLSVRTPAQLRTIFKNRFPSS